MRPNIGGVRGGRVGNMDQNNFMESLDAALKSRSEIPQMIASLVEENVTRTEFQTNAAAVIERLAEVEAKLNALLEQSTGPEPAEVKTAKPAKAKDGK